MKISMENNLNNCGNNINCKMNLLKMVFGADG